MVLILYRLSLELNKSLGIRASQVGHECGVPVGRRSGGRLATMLVATKNNILFFFFFLFSLFVLFFPFSTFLIEGVLGSKNLFRES